MKVEHVNQKNIISKFAAIVFCLLTMTFAAAAQTAIQYDALYNCPKSSMYNFKVLNCPNDQSCEVAFYSGEPLAVSFKDSVYKSRIADALKAGCTINGKSLDSARPPVTERTKPGNDSRPSEEKTETSGGRFKVGERVLASPLALIADKEFEKCTVVQDYLQTEGYDTYQVLCDNPNGGIGRKANVKVPYIKAWANAEPPPTAPECNFNEPAGKITKTSPATAVTFKRVIYDRLAANSNGRRVGITFESFQLGKSYVNRLTNNGLLHDGAPQGAMIYTMKTKFIFCDRHTDSTIRWVYDSQYECFKDKFGEWVCPSKGLNLSEPIYLPNN